MRPATQWTQGAAGLFQAQQVEKASCASQRQRRRPPEGKIVFYSLTEEGDHLFGLLAGQPALAALAETRT